MMAGPNDLDTDTNQQQGHASGLGGLAQSAGIGSSFQANGPNPGAYNAFIGDTGHSQESYDQQAAAAQQRTAPVISNPYQDQSRTALAGTQGEFGGLLGALNDDISNPQDSVAVNQFRQATDQSIAAQAALANSARGGAVAQAGAQRAAMEQGAQARAAASAQAAEIAEQDRFAAIQAAGGINNMSGNLNLGQYGLEQQNAQQQAALQAQRNAQNDSYSLGLGGLAQGYSQEQLAAMGQYGGLVNQAQAINAQTSTNAAQAGQGLLGTILKTAGVSGAGGLGTSGGAAEEGLPPNA